MDLIEECVMMKEPSSLSISLVRVPEDAFSIGILLTCPMSDGTLSLLEALLKISSCNELPSKIRLAALSKFYRHLAEIHNFFKVQIIFKSIISLLKTSSRILSELLALNLSDSLVKYLILCLNQSIQRLTFEFRTKIEVVEIIIVVCDFLKIIKKPSALFYCSREVLGKSTEYLQADIDSLVLIILHFHEKIAQHQCEDFDPLKNVFFIITLELLTRLETSKLEFSKVNKLLQECSASFTKAQRVKVLTEYTHVCRKLGLSPDSIVTDRLYEVKNSFEVVNTAWDEVETGPQGGYYEIRYEVPPPPSIQASDIYELPRFIEEYKKKFSSGYISPDSIKDFMVAYQVSKSLSPSAVTDQIIQILDQGVSIDKRFWGVMINGIRRSNILGQDQISKIISKVNGYGGRNSFSRAQDSTGSFDRGRNFRYNQESMQKIEPAPVAVIASDPSDIWGEHSQSVVGGSFSGGTEEVKENSALGVIKVELAKESIRDIEKNIIEKNCEENESVIEDSKKKESIRKLEGDKQFKSPSWEVPAVLIQAKVIAESTIAVDESEKKEKDSTILESPKQSAPPSWELPEKLDKKKIIAESVLVLEENKSKSDLGVGIEANPIFSSDISSLQQKVTNLSQKIIDTVDNKTPSELRYRDLQLFIEKFKKIIQSKFPSSEISIVGSISYGLFLESSAIDLQITNPQLPDKDIFQSCLQDYLTPQGACSSFPRYLQFAGDCVFHLYCNTSLPLHTSLLLSRYNSTKEINTFLYYIKLWAFDLQLEVTGYFWTLSALFYLWNCEPPVLPHLQQDEIHSPVPVEGFDVWVDGRDLEISEKSSCRMYEEFMQLLRRSIGCVFIGKTGEIICDEEYALGVSDLFTDKIIGIPVKYLEILKTKINQSCDEVLGIIKM